MVKYKLTLFLLLMLTYKAYSQSKKEYKYRYNYHQLDSIIFNTDGPIEINDAIILPIEEQESKHYKIIPISGNKMNLDSIDNLYKNYDVSILFEENIETGEFTESYQIPIGIQLNKQVHITFKNCLIKEARFSSSKFRKLAFENCTIESIQLIGNELSYLKLNYCDLTSNLPYSYRIINNEFKSEVEINNLYSSKRNIQNYIVFEDNSFFDKLSFKNNHHQNLRIRKNEFRKLNNRLYWENWHILYQNNISEGYIMIDSNTFYLDRNLLEKVSEDLTTRKIDTIYRPDFNYNFCFLIDNKINNITLGHNNFIYSDTNLFTSYNYSLANSVIDELTITNENIYRIDLDRVSVNKHFNVYNTNIKKDYSAKGIEIPKYDIRFNWDIFNNKLNFRLNDTTYYKPDASGNASDFLNYSEYISSLNKFYLTYKNRGDLQSSNKIYVEMKDAEYYRLKFLYDENGGFENYLKFKLNGFLKYFADYGTNPVKSVKISAYVILIFSLFYFFIHSEWDKINRRFLMNKGRQLISYFNSEQKLEDFYTQTHQENIEEYIEFKKSLENSKSEVPIFFGFFLKPLYWISLIRHKSSQGIYKKLEILKGKWIDLDARKKLIVSSITLISVFFYGLYLFSIRSINSLMLSINTFTTLGFGEIPVKGIGRYIAILEGFLGWFLLSIFSVSLISQIIQN